MRRTYKVMQQDGGTRVVSIFYNLKDTLGGVEYTDDLKPYIMFVDHRSMISIKNAVIGLYTKNLVYLGNAINSYDYTKA